MGLGLAYSECVCQFSLFQPKFQNALLRKVVYQTMQQTDVFHWDKRGHCCPLDTCCMSLMWNGPSAEQT